MKLADCIRKMIRDYFTIFGIILICITLSRQIFLPDKAIELQDIYIYMLCSLICDLPTLIFYSPGEISENEMRIRRILRFIILQVIVMVFSYLTGFTEGILNTVLLEIQIIAVYLLGRLLSWMDDRRSADRINRKLNALREELSMEQKE